MGLSHILETGLWVGLKVFNISNIFFSSGKRERVRVCLGIGESALLQSRAFTIIGNLKLLQQFN